MRGLSKGNSDDKIYCTNEDDPYMLDEHLVVKHEFRQANNFYQEAEILLIETLRFKDFSLQTENYSIKSFKDSYENTGRMDAKFYQEKYGAIERIFRNYDAYIKYLDEVVLVMEIAIEQGEGAILKCKLERDLL